MTTHNMKLYGFAGESFRMISTGIKTIELRLYDEKRRKILPGDRIIFTFENDMCEVMVLGLTLSDNFANLAKIVNVQDTGWCDAEDLTAGLLNFYSKDDQEKYGVVGIHIRRIP